MVLKRVVVTGLGALTPIGNTYQEYWEGLKNGKSGAAPITRFDASLFKTKFACELKNFEIGNFMDRKEARKMDPFAQYAMVVADEAIKDSNLPLTELNPHRVGVIWGRASGGYLLFRKKLNRLLKVTVLPRFNPFFIPKMIPDLKCRSHFY
jgi:3-oxoacyl-[acyl-carrier-protein] synthase II